MSKYVTLRWSTPQAMIDGLQPVSHVPNYFGQLGIDESSPDVALASECPCMKCQPELTSPE